MNGTQLSLHCKTISIWLAVLIGAPWFLCETTVGVLLFFRPDIDLWILVKALNLMGTTIKGLV